MGDPDLEFIRGFDSVTTRHHEELQHRQREREKLCYGYSRPKPSDNLPIPECGCRRIQYDTKPQTSRIGDAFLESIVDENIIETVTNADKLRTFCSGLDSRIDNPGPYKRDYSITDINEPGTDTIQFNVYAVSLGRNTRVINLTTKRNSDRPIIHHYETFDDPSTVVDLAYPYNLGRPRTAFSKNINRRTKNVSEDLVELEILVKNKQYISDAPYETLVKTVDYLTF